jgi:hypothetical protein
MTNQIRIAIRQRWPGLRPAPSAFSLEPLSFRPSDYVPREHDSLISYGKIGP